jgi:hypothetical protein
MLYSSCADLLLLPMLLQMERLLQEVDAARLLQLLQQPLLSSKEGEGYGFHQLAREEEGGDDLTYLLADRLEELCFTMHLCQHKGLGPEKSEQAIPGPSLARHMKLSLSLASSLTPEALLCSLHCRLGSELSFADATIASAEEQGHDHDSSALRRHLGDECGALMQRMRSAMQGELELVGTEVVQRLLDRELRQAIHAAEAAVI